MDDPFGGFGGMLEEAAGAAHLARRKTRDVAYELPVPPQ